MKFHFTMPKIDPKVFLLILEVVPTKLLNHKDFDQSLMPLDIIIIICVYVQRQQQFRWRYRWGFPFECYAVIPRKSPVDNLFYLPCFLQNAVSENWRLEKDFTENASLLSSQETTLTMLPNVCLKPSKSCSF